MAASLGGSRHATLHVAQATGQVVPSDYRDVQVDWDQFDPSTVATFRAAILLINNKTTGAATAAIWCVETATVMLYFTAVGWNSTRQTQDLFLEEEKTLASPGGGLRTYRLIFTNLVNLTIADVKAFATLSRMSVP